MIPPGLIGRAFAEWIAGALLGSGSSSSSSSSSLSGGEDVEIVVTSHVPVYGYGKSHGYSKLVRFVITPLPLAAYDAYSFARSSSSTTTADEGGGDRRGGGDASSSLRGGRAESGAETQSSSSSSSPPPPAAATIGMMVRLVMRWHCRLSRE
jgi:hypothetical protein